MTRDDLRRAYACAARGHRKLAGDGCVFCGLREVVDDIDTALNQAEANTR